MSTKIGDKTPAQIHNDLFYLNNGNVGIENEVKSLYSGNGIATPLKIGIEKLEANFYQGELKSPLLNQCHLYFNDIGEISGSYQISTTGGNTQKITLIGNVSLTILSNVNTSNAFEITLLVEQSSGGNTITFPSNFKTSSHLAISFSSNAGAIDILKFLTYDGGETWIVYKIAADLR